MLSDFHIFSGRNAYTAIAGLAEWGLWSLLGSPRGCEYMVRRRCPGVFGIEGGGCDGRDGFGTARAEYILLLTEMGTNGWL